MGGWRCAGKWVAVRMRMRLYAWVCMVRACIYAWLRVRGGVVVACVRVCGRVCACEARRHVAAVQLRYRTSPIIPSTTPMVTGFSCYAMLCNVVSPISDYYVIAK